MKTITALLAVLSLFAFTAVAVAGNTHCTHLKDDCVAAPSSHAAHMTEADYLP